MFLGWSPAMVMRTAGLGGFNGRVRNWLRMSAPLDPSAATRQHLCRVENKKEDVVI
jgi:hypothetical protein